jgi:hypothetical protein
MKCKPYKAIMAAVIFQALNDLKSAYPKCRDDGMKFFHSDNFGNFCIALNLDEESIRQYAIRNYPVPPGFGGCT